MARGQHPQRDTPAELLLLVDVHELLRSYGVAVVFIESYEDGDIASTSPIRSSRPHFQPEVVYTGQLPRHSASRPLPRLHHDHTDAAHRVHDCPLDSSWPLVLLLRVTGDIYTLRFAAKSTRRGSFDIQGTSLQSTTLTSQKSRFRC